MPERRPNASPFGYDDSVFINCPFDDHYQPLFEALVFAVRVCGLTPRCALEVNDASQVRIEKIYSLIRLCRWGIHDLSRTELNDFGLPRFNMPLELGIFLGAKKFGSSFQRHKSCLILDSEPFRYQRFISDIAGQDVTSHHNDAAQAITAVRDWLAASRPIRHGAGDGAVMGRQFAAFRTDFPALCRRMRISPSRVIFADFIRIIDIWLEAEAAISGP